MISVRTDIKSPKIGETEWSYNGLKSKITEMNMTDIIQFVQDNQKILSIHEVLTGERYRPYADLDFSPKEKVTEEEFNEIQYKYLLAGWKTMEQLFPLGELHMLCASSFEYNKISAHFIMNGIYYTEKDHIEFIMKSCDMKALEFDQGVYTKDHLMRIGLCSKPEQERPLRRAELISFQNCGIVHYLDKKTKDSVKYISACLSTSLITYTLEEDDEMPVPEGFVAKEKPKKIVKDEEDLGKSFGKFTDAEIEEKRLEMIRLIAALKDSRADDNRTSRATGIWAIRSVAKKYKQVAAWRFLAHTFAKRAGHYDEVKTDDLYMAEPKEISVGYKRLKEWADEDTPGWNNCEVAISYYDNECRLLVVNHPKVTRDMVEKYFLGCLAFIEDTEQWHVRFKRGWGKIPGDGKFPFNNDSSKGSITIGDNTISLKKILLDLKQKPAFQHCCYASEEYVPYFKVEPAKCWNKFPGWLHKFGDSQETHAVTRFLELLFDLSGRDDKMFLYFKGWFATYVQKPQEKMPLIMLYSEVQGCGKGILETFCIEYLFGLKQVMGITNLKVILGHFNQAAAENQLVICQEGKKNGGSVGDEGGTLKELITGKRITTMGKCKEAQKNNVNYAKYMVCTNHPDCLEVEPSCRRAALASCFLGHVGDFAYFDKLMKDLYTVDSGDQVLSYLAAYDLSEFEPRNIPMTQLKLNAINKSLPKPILHIQAICEGKRHFGKFYNSEAKVVKLDQLYADFRNWAESEGITFKCLKTSYKHDIETRLGLISKQQGVNFGRKSGILIDYDLLDEAFQKLQHRTTSCFEPEEDCEDDDDDKEDEITVDDVKDLKDL